MLLGKKITYIFLRNVWRWIQRRSAAPSGTRRHGRGCISAEPGAFLQWLYLREVSFDLDEPENQISAAIELARFADMCKITGIESDIAEYFKRILVINPGPEPVEVGIHINNYFLTSQHIVSTTFLPRGHAVCWVLAAAMVEQSLLCEDDWISGFPSIIATWKMI